MKHFHKNPRQITEKQFNQLQGWLEEYGDLSGIVHNIKTDEIIGGNQRAEAMHFIGNGAKPVIIKQYDKPTKQGTVAQGYYEYKGERFAYRQVKWTDKKAEHANMIANKAGGSFDFDIMANEWGFDVLLNTGWEKKELLGAGFEFEDTTQDADVDMDRAAELLKKWKVKTGDLWQIGEHRLICGDCTDVAVVARVMGGERARMLFTDAPYNTGETWSGLQEYRGHEQVENDNREDWQAWAADCLDLWLANALDENMAGYWWFGQRESPRELLEKTGMKIRGHLVWVKEHYNVGRADYHSQYEECQYFSRGERYFNGARNQSDVRTANRVEEERLHPTQKPVSLLQGLIEQHDIDIIFDPFVGSGTTLVACENLGRNGRAIEISPAYCSVTLQRMQDAFPSLEIRKLK